MNGKAGYMIPTNLKIPFFIALSIFIIYLVSKLTRSNFAEVEYTFVKADSIGGNGGDIPALRKLNELVEKNYLNRSYYEASSIETASGMRWFVNYNKNHQALFIGTNDGWSYFFYATPLQLKMIADRKIPAYKFHQFLKPFPPEFLGEVPTRSRDIFLFF